MQDEEQAIRSGASLDSSAHDAMEAAGLGFLMRNMENGYCYWNTVLHEMCGSGTAARLQSPQHPLPNIHVEDLDTVRQHVERGRISGDPIDIEYRIVAVSGELRWVREQGRFLLPADSLPLRYSAVLRDITEERKKLSEYEESRRLLKLSLESNDIGVWEWNRSTGQQSWSNKIWEILGYEPGGITPGQDAWKAALHPDDREWASSVFDAECQEGILSFTYRIIVNGAVRWIRESWRDFLTEDGVQIRLGVTADVTNWKEQERRLIVSDSWLKLAVHGGRMGLWSYDLTTMDHQWNDNMFNLLGYAAGEAMPSVQAWNSRIHPADIERVRAELASSRANGGEIIIEYRILLPGGVERWVEERGRARDAHSPVYDGVLFDVTERKVLLQQLAASQQRLQLALETGRMGFWTGHGEHEIWDDRTYRLLDFEPQSVKPCQDTFLNVLHPEDRRRVAATDERLRQASMETVREYRIVKRDGSFRWIESHRRSAPGKTPDRFGILLDVTDRKLREELHLKSQRLEAAGQLLRGLAHDFNNFLAVISATLESAGEMQHDPATAQRLREARHAAMAGALFSRRLVNISRGREWRPQVLSAGEHIQRLAEVISLMLKRDVSLTVSCCDDLWSIHVDPLECDSAIINLVINARDAMPSGGSVTIAMCNEPHASPEASGPGHQAGYVLIEVTDTGKGMDGETLRRATEPFFTTKPDGAGTGLGLSSVAAFAAAAGGSMSIASEPGRGTTVSLRLPRLLEHHAAAANAGTAPPRGMGELILVVDDEAYVRESTMQRLEALGYAVEESSEGAGAIDMLRSHPDFALVLSDISMPGAMDGFALRDKLAEEMPHLPVLLITAHEELVTGDGMILSKSSSQQDLAQALADALLKRKLSDASYKETRETGHAST